MNASPSMLTATLALHALDPARWRALAVLLLALFMVLLDSSIVTNGLATLQRTLGASSSQVQFVLTGYAVAYGVLLITGGRLGAWRPVRPQTPLPAGTRWVHARLGAVRPGLVARLASR